MRLRLPDPALASDDVVLRPWRPGDAERLVQAWSDPEIARWNPIPPEPTLDMARRWIDGCEARLVARISLDLCVTLDDLVIGEVGLSSFDTAHKGALIGYWLLPEGRGTGRATASLRAVTEWAFEDLGLEVLVARCAAANQASHAVARRAGYAHTRDDDAGYQLWTSRPAPETPAPG